jgi:hypothetical protein
LGLGGDWSTLGDGSCVGLRNWGMPWGVVKDPSPK